MDFEKLRETFVDFYQTRVDAMSDAFRERVYPLLEAAVTPEMSGYARKALQYRTIAAECTPVLLPGDPFYHELGTMAAICDGAGSFRGHVHAGNWNYARSAHLFVDQDPALWARRSAQGKELLYLICGPYCDTRQHFYINAKPVFRIGLRGLYEKAQAQTAGAQTAGQREFLDAACTGLLAMKTLSEKLAAAAAAKLSAAPETETDPVEAANLRRIADSAAYCPWNAPRTFYEALNTLAFLRTAAGALEGVGVNSFGRPDVELLPFYERDLAAGTLTKRDAEDLIRAFLLIWDCRYDHDMKMVGYSDHEMENTYTVGGCGADGKPVWNDLTELFLRVTREEKIIYPKVMVRFGADSPKAYLDAVDEDVIRGTSSVLYQNDDASIPSLVRAGASLEDARDYIVCGCWDMMTNGNVKHDSGNYVNLLKAFEFSVHDRKDKMEECGITFEPLDGAESFEEVYRRTMDNCRTLFAERNRMTLAGKGVWPEADPCPLLSSALEGCLDSRRDMTDGGCRYKDENYVCVGLPNIVDSLLAIRTLCFEKRICTLAELLDAVRADWAGREDLRQAAMRCEAWGDGGEESSALAARFNHDLYEALLALPTLWGGKIFLGHRTYTEIRFWGEKTLATPDGRHSGDYFSQGLTPSRLHHIGSVTDVIRSLAALDRTELAGNTVVNIILPHVAPEVCEAFLRAAADSSMESLQLNCTTKEELLDAQVHPENHRNLIVRVCGFSARFTSLSPEWQKEFLSRNFYD